MSRKLALLIALSPALWLSTVSALGLGEIEVKSRLNQRFSATIPLTSLSPEEAENIRVGLASNADFSRSGLDRTDYLGSLVFTVSTEGGPHIEVSSPQIAREPFVAFLVDVRSPTGRLQREYTVLLDPAGAPDPDSGIATAPATTTPVAPSTSRSDFYETTEEAGKPTQPPATSTPEPEPAPAEVAPVAPVETAEAPITGTTPDSYGPVQTGETFWSIATKLRPDPKITMDQMLLAIYEANPGAFDGGSINGLRRGATLKIPSVEAITSTSATSAKSRVGELRGLPPPAPRAPAPVEPKPEPATSAFSPEPAPAPIAKAPPRPVTPEAEKKTEPPKPVEPPPAPKPAPVAPPPAQVTPPPEPVTPPPAQATPPPADPSAATTTPPPSDPATTPSAGTEPAPLDPVDTAATPGETPVDPAPVEPAPAPVLPEPPSDDVGGLLGQYGIWILLIFAVVAAAVFGATRYMKRQAKPAPPPMKPAATLQPRSAAAAAAAAAAVAAAGGAPGRKPLPPAAPAAPSLMDRIKGLLKRDKSAAPAPAKPAPVATAPKAVPQPPPKPSAREQLESLETTLGDEPPPAMQTSTREMPPPRPAMQQAPSLGATTRMATPVVASAPTLPPLPSELPMTNETQQLPTFDATEIMEVEAARTAVEQGNVDFDVTQQFATETVQINLDTNDPISEADFHLAYGLYEEAALLLKQAADKNPDRTELRVKLAETYFAAGKPVEFTQVAETLKDQLPAAEWQKLAILGQQLNPDSPLFKDAGGASLATDLDLVFDEASPSSRIIQAAPSSQFEASPATKLVNAPAAVPAPTGGGGGLDFKLEELELPKMELPTASAAPAAAGKSDALEFDLGDFDLNKADDDLSATAQPGARQGNAVEFESQPIDLGATDTGSKSAAKGGADTSGMRLDDFDIGEMPAEADGISAGDEAGTKLDLARAYVDMGDNDMARNLLNEVMQQGTDAQKKEASGLLGRLS